MWSRAPRFTSQLLKRIKKQKHRYFIEHHKKMDVLAVGVQLVLT